MRADHDRDRVAGGRGRAIELVAGVLLGIVLGIAVAYLLVIVAGGKDASSITTGSQAQPPAKGTTTGDGRSGRAAP
jgi:hypothetical protein